MTHQPTRTINITGKVVEVEKVWFTRQEAARYLGTSHSYIKTLNLTGRLRYYHAGKIVFISKEDLDRYIRSCRVY